MKFRCVCAVLALFVVMATVYFGARQSEIALMKEDQVRGDLADRFLTPRTAEYKGRTFRYRTALTSILIMGVDREAKSQGAFGFRNGGQADFLLLLVIDSDRRLITPIMIDRDTMAQIEVLDVMDRPEGKRLAQVSLSHGFGDGGARSCQYTQAAVGELLMNIDIDHYLAFDIGAIRVINDDVGGVTVNLEDDFSTFDPAMKESETVTLMGRQAEIFTRWRMDVGDGTNQSRMRRQQAYMTAFANKLKAKVHEDVDFVYGFFDEIESSLTTDIKRGSLINEINRASNYKIATTRKLEGVHTIGADGHMEFWADQEQLAELVMNVFFEQAEESAEGRLTA